jgi:hypothetical protein
MASLPSGTFFNNTTPLYLGNNGSILAGTISSMTTDRITLDGQTLDATSAGGGTLLINGVAVASAQTLTSSIANWAQFTALSSITYTTAGGTGGTINMNLGQFSTLNNLAGSISTLSVSSINGYNANSSGGVIVDATNRYSYSTSNAAITTTSPVQVAGVATGLYTLVVGKQYMISVPVQGYLGSTVGVLYLSASLGTASTQCFPQALDSAASTTTGTLEPLILTGVVTASATDAGLYLYVWRGGTALEASSLQIFVNPATVSGGITNGGITITQLN